MAQFGWGPRATGFVFFYVGVLSATLQGGLIGRLTGRFGEQRLMLSGLGLVALGLLLLAVSSDLPRLLAAVTLLAVGNGAAAPSINSLISRNAGAAEQGEMMGVAQSVGSLSRVLGPLAAGLLFTELGRGSPFLWGFVLVAAALGLSWQVPR